MYRRRYESRRSSKLKHALKTKRNKIWRKSIFNMADRILTPCNVPQSWHWFRQVTAPCDVAYDVAMESWQWIHQGAAPCNATRGSGMTCHRIRPNVRHIGTLHLVSISTTSPPSAEQNDVMSIFKMADLDGRLEFRDSIMGSLKSPSTTSYRSSIDTIALNCLVFEKIAFFCILATDRQTNRWTAPTH